MMNLIVDNEGLVEEEAKRILRQILLALQYIHSRKIVHRDLKSGNIFLGDKDNIKIGDFGVCCLLPRTPVVDTKNYMSPEMSHPMGHSYPTDIYSVGVILFNMLNNIPKKAESEEAKDLIRKLMEYNPGDRLTAEKALEHPFFSRKRPADYEPSSSKSIIRGG